MHAATKVNTPRLKTKLKPRRDHLDILRVQMIVKGSTNRALSVMMLKMQLPNTNLLQSIVCFTGTVLSKAAFTGRIPKASTKTVEME